MDEKLHASFLFFSGCTFAGIDIPRIYSHARWSYHRRFRSLLFVSHVCRALSFPFMIADLKLRVNGTLWRTDRADRLQTSRVAGREEGSIVITAHRKVVVVIARTVVMATRQRSLRRRTGPDNRKGSFAVTSHVYCQWADQNKWFDISPVQSPATCLDIRSKCESSQVIC